MKTCKKCNIEQPLIDNFYKNNLYVGGYIHTCIKCVLERNKKYKASNKEKVKIDKQLWKSNNKDNTNIKQQEWRRHNTPSENQRLSLLLRNRVNAAIKTGQKAGSAVRDLGCSINKLKIHLQLKFHRNPRGSHECMTWNNHSRKGWYIDHIKPLSKFDLTDRTQFLEACHYTNLQPMWATDNLKKGGF